MISEALGGRYIHPENVTARPSSKGKYVSANVTLEMESGDDVLAVYGVLKADKRVLWYL
jgi:putative lipoic acid-binding regulatory protein